MTRRKRSKPVAIPKARAKRRPRKVDLEESYYESAEEEHKPPPRPRQRAEPKNDPPPQLKQPEFYFV